MNAREKAEMDQGLAAMVEMHAGYYKGLVANGVPKDVATHMSIAYVTATVSGVFKMSPPPKANDE